ncbi:hypothetical protein [Methanococcoides alaskense]|uniref:Uncharacterized protein n=1 Tax=Methanococcoides alaskense TaxID=325778 RepID=A0AA90TX82_9EURY|nr:hypothetical protein [Methanococcoides alaskense]MDA0525385.1 hypothetical protein [Methanococcoides alaskense]MDR6221684.1 hypothetical protein [Methanococcoides alaskense]
MSKIYIKLKNFVYSTYLDALKDHFKAIIAFIILAIAVTLKEYIYKILTYEIHVWKVITFVLILVLIYMLTIYLLNHEKCILNRHGFIWKINLIGNKIIYLSDPLCPNCDCDLLETSNTTSEKTLMCTKCHKVYGINPPSIKNLQDSVKQIVKSDLKSNKSLDVNWSIYFNRFIYDYPSSKLSIKNKGIFDVDDVTITINVEADDKRDFVKTYELGIIGSESSKKVSENDPMGEVLKILSKWNLLRVFEHKRPIKSTDDFGEISEKDEFYYTRYAMKEFTAKLFVDITYSIKNKTKKQNLIFHLKPKFIDLKSWHDNYDHTNCIIDIVKID